MKIVKRNKCGHPHNPNIGDGRCQMCGGVKTDSSQYQGTYYRPVIDHATASKKYHFSNYYRRYRICKNCGEYVPVDEVCPACGKEEMNIVIANKYCYSNPRRCDNCSYESRSFHICPKCGSEMRLIHQYLIGDFTSLGEHYPDVDECSEDEEVLEISETYLCFNALANVTHKIYITCNYYDWYVQNDSKWLVVSEDWRGESLSITILPNMNKQKRTAIIDIRCGEVKKEIVICQNGLSVSQIRSLRNLWTYLKHITGMP